MNTAPIQVAAKCHQPASPHFWSANGCSTPLVGPLRAVPPTWSATAVPTPWSAPSGLFHPPGRPPQGCSTPLVSQKLFHHKVGQRLFHHKVSQRLFHHRSANGCSTTSSAKSCSTTWSAKGCSTPPGQLRLFHHIYYIDYYTGSRHRLQQHHNLPLPRVCSQ